MPQWLSSILPHIYAQLNPTREASSSVEIWCRSNIIAIELLLWYVLDFVLWIKFCHQSSLQLEALWLLMSENNERTAQQPYLNPDFLLVQNSFYLCYKNLYIWSKSDFEQ